MNTYRCKFETLEIEHKINDPNTVDDEYTEHFHLGYELLYFLDGDIEYVIENKRYVLKPGDLLFIKPGEHHFLTILSPRRYERVVIKFNEIWIPAFSLPVLKRRGSHYSIAGTELEELFDRFDRHAAHYSGDVLHVLMRSCLDELLVKYWCLDMDELPATDLNKTVSEVIEYITENISQPLTVDDLCKKFGFSRSYISKAFMESLHEPPKQYIINKKILHAKALLEKGESPTKVCELCGFADYSTFYRAYKKNIGVPPSGNERR